jgi:GNAT superfamily N-acetyltransferase
MGVTVRAARPGDGDGIGRAWLSAAAYFAALDPGHFQVPAADGLAASWDDELGQDSDDTLRLVADVDGQVCGWLAARIEPPVDNAAAQLTREPGWTVLVIDALIVHRDHWRRGAGTALLEAAEAWGRARGARVVRLDTMYTAPSRCRSTKSGWDTSAVPSSFRSSSSQRPDCQ